MARVQDEYFFIDSLDRDFLKYPNPANYVIKPIHELRNVDTIELMTLQLVKSEPNINSGNSTFQIIYSGTTYTFSLQTTTNPPVYQEIVSGTTIQSLIASQISSFGIPLTCSFSSTPGSLSTIGFTSTTGPFSLVLTEYMSMLLGIIVPGGARGAGTVASTLISTTHTISGTRPINLSGVPYISLYVNDYERLKGSGSMVDGSYFTIPLENKAYNTRFLITNDEKEKKGIYYLKGNQRVIREFRIRFTRPNGSLYDFQGTEHFMVFRITRKENKDYLT